MAWRTVFLAPLSRALIVFVFGLMLSTALFIARYRLESSKANTDFSQRANARIAAVTDRIHASIDSLESVNRLFVLGSQNISRAQFQRITQPY